MRRIAKTAFVAVAALASIAMAGVVLGSMGVGIQWTGFGTAHAQITGTGVAAPKGGHVTFVPESSTIAAGKPSTIALHFRVDPSFHINSHTPKSDMLIPTKILVEDMNGADVSDVSFPAGTPYSFSFEPKTKLDVYTGDVTLTAHVKAKPGTYTLKAALHYQACDQAACYPPKTLPVEQPFTAK